MRCAPILLVALWAVSAQTPVGSVHGVVRDANSGALLPDITIQAASKVSTPRLIVATDEDGRYSISDLPVGPLSITASNIRHKTVVRSVQLTEGDDLTVDFLIPANSTLSGRVVNAGMEPVAGAAVWAIRSQYYFGVLRNRLIGPQLTGPDGRFDFEYQLVAGLKYHLLADRAPSEEIASGEPKPPGQKEPIEIPTYFGDAISLEAATPLVLQPSEQRDNVEIKIRKSAYYCADGAAEAAGKPAATPLAIQDQALAGTSLTRVSTSSAPDGTFRVCGLADGQYRITAMGSPKFAGSTEFVIAGSDVHHLHFAVDMVPLHLQVIWDGAPPPEPEPKTTGPVRYFKEGGQWVMRVYPEAGSAPTSEEVAAASRKLGGFGPIAVEVHGLSNEILIRRSVRAPFDAPFDSSLPAGDYGVYANLSPYCCYVKAMTYGGVPLANNALHLAAGTSGTLRVVLARDGATFTCKVVDDDGKPAPDATVLLIPDGIETPGLVGSPIKSSGADRDGTARFGEFLAPGKYRVLAVNRRMDFREDLDKVWLAISKATDIGLAPNATVEVSVRTVSID